MRLTAPCGCKTDYEVYYPQSPFMPKLQNPKPASYCTKHEPIKTVSDYEKELTPYHPPSCESVRRRYVAYSMRRLRPIRLLTPEEAYNLVELINKKLTTSRRYMLVTPPVPVKIKITSEQIAPDKAHINVDVIRDDEWGV